jgi:bisphosphoglycerate-dependent phosphoglycerate mutase
MLQPKYLDYLLENYEIEIYLIRHGKSINNHIGKLAKFGNIIERFKHKNYYKNEKYKDCKLTDKGIIESLQLGNDLNIYSINFDYVFCSPLNRCIETSYYSLKNMVNKPKEIIINSNLRELIESIGDYPDNIKSKYEFVKNNYSCLNYNFDEILEIYKDGNIVNKINKFKKDDNLLQQKEYLIIKENAYKFWCYLLEKLYNNFYNNEKYINTDKKKINIGIYSHCGFISIFVIELLKYYFYNNDDFNNIISKVRKLKNTEILKLKFSKNNKNKNKSNKIIYNRNYKLELKYIDFTNYYK